MELIPTITMKKRKIINQQEESDNIFNQINEEDLLYILDLDGIEKDKPNLCKFQRLSKKYKLWLDYGPRNLGDIVDAFMAGATAITIRSELCMQLNISNIREITENKIYVNINFEQQKNIFDKEKFYQESDGLINFNNIEKINLYQNYIDIFKNEIYKNKIYSYENNPINISYWKNLNIKGLIVDVNKKNEFEKYAL